MRFRTSIAATAAVVTGAIGSTFAAAPAMASQRDCTAYPGTICMAENSDWSGRIWRQFPDQVVGCRPLSRDTFNNKASIVVNSTPAQVVVFLYDNANCTGASISVDSGWVRFLQNDPFNDKASSIRVIQL